MAGLGWAGAAECIELTAECGMSDMSPSASLAGRSFLNADSGFPFRGAAGERATPSAPSAGDDGAETHTLESRPDAVTIVPTLAPVLSVGLVEACCICMCVLFGPCVASHHITSVISTEHNDRTDAKHK